MANAIPTVEQIDFKKIQIQPPRDNKNAPGKTSGIRYAGSTNGQFIILLKNIQIRYSMFPYTDPKTGIPDKKLNLNISLEEDEAGNLKNPELHKFLTKLQAHLIELINTNAEEWGLPRNIGNKFNDLIKPHINKSTKERYVDTWTVRIQMDPETCHIKSKFFDGADKNKQIPVTFENAGEQIPAFTRANLYIHINKVWFSGSALGMSTDLIQGSFNRPIGVMSLPEIIACDDDLAGRDRVEKTIDSNDFDEDDDESFVIETTDSLSIDDDDIEQHQPKKTKGKGKAKK